MLDFIKRSVQMSGEHKGKMRWGMFFIFIKDFALLLTFTAIYFGIMWMEEIAYSKIWTLFLILFASFIFGFIANWIQNIFIAGTFFTIYKDYRLKIGEKLKKAPMGYFSEQSLSKILSCFTNVIKNLENLSQLTFDFTISGISISFFILIGMFSMNLKMGGLALVLVIVSWLVISLLIKNMKKYVKQEHEATVKFSDALVDGIRGVSVLRSFPNLGERKVKQIHSGVYDTAESLRLIYQKMELVFTVYSRIYVTFLNLSSLVMTLYACKLYVNNEIQLAQALTLCVASFMLFGGLRKLENAAVLLVKNPANLDYLSEVLDIPKISEGDIEEVNENSISFENVSFAYDKKEVIKDMSFEIKDGEALAIVGPSGSGKTTIINLISRFYDVDKGSVKIGGNDIKAYKVDALLKELSLVFQDVYLFNDSIKNNIKFANPNASNEEIIEASKKAMCHEFIMEMKDGYESEIGEGGSTLSGGEKQRISIARALIKDAPIILLDEATSSVDPENEYEIMKAINELKKGRTVISIAHRLSTVKNADKILVIDDGRLVQVGKHEDLLAQEGIYKKFIEAREEASNWEILN